MKTSLRSMFSAIAALLGFGVLGSVPSPILPPTPPSPRAWPRRALDWVKAAVTPSNRHAASRGHGRPGRRKVARLSPGWRWILKTHRKSRPWIGTTKGGAISRTLARYRRDARLAAHFQNSSGAPFPQAKAA